MENWQTLVAAYKAHLQTMGKSSYTVKQYALDAKQFADLYKEDELVNDLLIRYIEFLKEQYTVNSINRKLAVVRSFLVFLYMRQEVDVYNEALLKPMMKEPIQLSVLSTRQVEQALSVWPSCQFSADTDENEWLAIRNGAITELIAELGLKPAEVVKMQWKHIDFDKNMLTVLASKAYRTIAFSPKLHAVLTHYKEKTAIFYPALAESEFSWISVGNVKGQPVTVKTIERIFQFISRNVGFKVTATNLRYATIQQLADKEDLYKQLGYARKGVLLERQQRMK